MNEVGGFFFFFFMGVMPPNTISYRVYIYIYKQLLPSDYLFPLPLTFFFFSSLEI